MAWGNPVTPLCPRKRDEGKGIRAAARISERFFSMCVGVLEIGFLLIFYAGALHSSPGHDHLRKASDSS